MGFADIKALNFKCAVFVTLNIKLIKIVKLGKFNSKTVGPKFSFLR